MKNVLGLKFILLLAGLMVGTLGNAASVTYSFSGLVTANNPNVLTPGAIPSPAIGSTFSGEFTIDDGNTNGVGSNCVAVINCWSDNLSSWAWDGLSVVNAGPGSEFRVSFDVVDAVAGAGQDELIVTLKGDVALLGVLSFIDSSGSAFESATSLVPSFAGFDMATYTFQPSCFGGIACFFSQRHSGVITAFSNPAVVPVPATLILLVSALLSLGTSKRFARKIR